MSDKIFSSHIFMFPFRFDLGYGEKYSNEFDFYKTKTIDERLKDLDKFKGWKLEPFNLKKEIQNHNDKMYNEYAYFYDYARDAIYNIDDSKDTISYYFEKKSEEATYQIDILESKESYKLNITGLSLKIFTTGVGILSIELENRDEKQNSFEDILKINDFGRRIYPQFIVNGKSDVTKNSFLANKITITSVNKESIIEPFLFTPNDDIVIGSHIMQLLGDSFTQEKNQIKKYYIQPILDDRMFVISWHENKALSNQLIDSNYIKSPSNAYEDYVFSDDNFIACNKSIYFKIFR